MGKNERRNSTQNMKKTGVIRPSKAASEQNKFIQYPTGTRVMDNPQGKKTLKPNPSLDNSKKSRKTIRKQRSRHILGTAVLVIILLAICMFISLKVLFIVRHVEMEGSSRYTREEIIGYCAIPLEENVFKIDTATLEENLPLEFTYVESADVQIRLPDKIVVKIVDSVPTYYNETTSGELSTYVIYSQNFKKLTVQAAAPEGLTGVSVNMENENARNILVDIIEKIQSASYENITCIAVSDKGEVSFVYDDRITVKLGTMLDMDYKMKLSYHVLTKELQSDDTGTVDSTQAGSAVFQPEK